ncbi:YeeE/YedE family protein [Comamonas terrigena]|uniref:YeeE/YedE thiosulfate transporter family protein n=1 Tax=Comamonas terrigena TaxID=32013 RepID=UPI00244CE6F9|nr:YeeE/YedE thiosulfate transporter family protein [Comamonas terrigena]MDH1290749.1 YeeE/YedE family protein [Comamonas terrigena]
MPPSTQLAAAFALGCAFGLAARLSRFCLLRGLRQAQGLDGDAARGSAPALQAFALALAVALLGTQALVWAGQLDWSLAPIVRTQFSVPGVLLGGALFGVGMVLARSCGARALVLLGGGNLRALVTLVFLGLAAQATFTGVLAPLRQWWQNLGAVALEHSTLPAVLSAAGGNSTTALALCTALPAAALLVYAFWNPALRRSPVQWLGAGVIGALVAAGWWISSHVGVDPFEPTPTTSLSLIAPVSESLLYLQLAVGRDFSWGPALAAGILAGAAAGALLDRSARWEGFDSTPRLAASALGGTLMGLGGVLAAGCSIGQGLSGLSTLAVASLPAAVGIVLGAWLALRLLPVTLR